MLVSSVELEVYIIDLCPIIDVIKKIVHTDYIVSIYSYFSLFSVNLLSYLQKSLK